MDRHQQRPNRQLPGHGRHHDCPAHRGTLLEPVKEGGSTERAPCRARQCGGPLAWGLPVRDPICLEVPDLNVAATPIEQAGGQFAPPKLAERSVGGQGCFVDPEANRFGVFRVDDNARWCELKSGSPSVG